MADKETGDPVGGNAEPTWLRHLQFSGGLFAGAVVSYFVVSMMSVSDKELEDLNRDLTFASKQLENSEKEVAELKKSLDDVYEVLSALPGPAQAESPAGPASAETSDAAIKQLETRAAKLVSTLNETVAKAEQLQTENESLRRQLGPQFEVTGGNPAPTLVKEVVLRRGQSLDVKAIDLQIKLDRVFVAQAMRQAHLQLRSVTHDIRETVKMVQLSGGKRQHHINIGDRTFRLKMLNLDTSDQKGTFEFREL